ncbi:MAG: M20/M25/M40 family metallo-hydrolase, partial [Deltaproteobacteria bacterium]|nr:M20/M25/M40 family metallo-hydrolase [Deltaproteobacteria bacterium]
ILKDADIEFETTEFAPHRKNLVARLLAQRPPGQANGDGGGPVLLVAHSDVVGASGQAWTVDPHKLTEKDGYLYGRGVADDLGMAVVNLEVFLLLKRAGAPLSRDVVFVLTGDEESGGGGINHILKNRPELLRGAIAFNEVGGPILDATRKKVRFVGLQASEKVYQDYELVTRGKTGHSSVPLEDNAIYRLARALDRLGKFSFPAHLLPVTRAYFGERAKIEEGKLAEAMRSLSLSKGRQLPAKALKTLEADPILAANLRTTCVATVLAGGTRVNALPAEARASSRARRDRLALSAAVRGALVRPEPDADGRGGHAARARDRRAHPRGKSAGGRRVFPPARQRACRQVIAASTQSLR